MRLAAPRILCGISGAGRLMLAQQYTVTHKIRGAAQPIQRNLSHARHDLDAGDDVSAVGQFDLNAAAGGDAAGPKMYGITYIVRSFIEPVNKPPKVFLASAEPSSCWSGRHLLSRVQMKGDFSWRAPSLDRSVQQGNSDKSSRSIVTCGLR